MIIFFIIGSIVMFVIYVFLGAMFLPIVAWIIDNLYVILFGWLALVAGEVLLYKFFPSLRWYGKYRGVAFRTSARERIRVAAHARTSANIAARASDRTNVARSK